MPCGRVPVYDVKADVLAAAMDELADLYVGLRFRVSRWRAQAHSWEVQKSAWLNLLSR